MLGEKIVSKWQKIERKIKGARAENPVWLDVTILQLIFLLPQDLIFNVEVLIRVLEKRLHLIGRKLREIKDKRMELLLLDSSAEQIISHAMPRSLNV